MKKVFSIIMCGLMLLTVACTKKKDSLLEQSLKSDLAYMEKTYGEEFVWFESQIVLAENLDKDCSGKIESVYNVFEHVHMYDSSADVLVVTFTHYTDGTVDTARVHDFWVEDCAMKMSDITINYNTAFSNLMKANCPKPNSDKCVLRKQVGPVEANPQYIFGNIDDCVFVDAVTGNVSTENPAFEPFK